MPSPAGQAVLGPRHSDRGRGRASRLLCFSLVWLWVPKDTPGDIIARLNAAMVQILADPMVQKRFDELGIQITPPEQQTPEALRVFQKAETERWWPIIKAADIK